MSSSYITTRPALAAISDGFLALSLTVRSSWRRLLVSWVYTPAGIFLILLACWGVDSAIRLTGVSFPASVACMILLFAGLVGCEVVLGERRTRGVVRVVDVPTGFALRYINVFFTPSFILLPLSPSIGGVEIGKIIAIFIIGFVVMLIFTAYLVQALQVLFKTSKHADESAPESIPLTNTPQARSIGNTPQDSLLNLETELVSPQPAAEPNHIRGPGPQCAFASQTPALLSILRQEGSPLSRPQRWAAFLNTHLDTATYSLFLLIGIVVFYTTSYAMPLHLSLNVLTYTLSLSLPPKARRILHPVLTTSLLTLLLLTLLSLSTHQPLPTTLKTYSTSTRYLSLFRGQTPSLPLPGAGDIFASVLDASIVSLALPMYTHRASLLTHLPSILLPCTALAAASLFAYPALCSALGLAPARALSFAARSLTLALALPAVGNLGGDANLAAVLCIMSGIVGVLVGGGVLRVAGVRREDYVTRGVAMGVNGGAIATAALVVGGDPRAAALGVLAMVVFGMGVVVLTAVPAVVGTLKGMVGI
ncbi:uncharacterized protein H6S33_001533 [Morchella sextelata]|uniref:uncharacterized protein n=1 Tax=Morchella sextelata TaxID=1174677 RepID=UPI001D03EF3C|nr:uncharacterized protein H6S33_001533 [Morchella sextelata]KAH0608399.1 hypothetical protein H6S33_001533 [Morchella sextelata]